MKYLDELRTGDLVVNQYGEALYFEVAGEWVTVRENKRGDWVKFRCRVHTAERLADEALRNTFDRAKTDARKVILRDVPKNKFKETRDAVLVAMRVEHPGEYQDTGEVEEEVP